MDQRVDKNPKFSSKCIGREILDQIAGKWSIMALSALAFGPLRFNAIRRDLEGITQKALTDTLRRLERNGLVERRVLDTAPVGVEYSLTPLGASLKSLYCTLYTWTTENGDEILAARARFDEKMIGRETVG